MPSKGYPDTSRWQKGSEQTNSESMTFVHLSKDCSQNKNTALGIMADVLTKLKIGIPNLD